MSYSEKIYPSIATAPPGEDEGQTYRLRKIDEMEKFLRAAIKTRDKLTKQFKHRATALTFSDTSILAAITTLEVASIVALTTGVGTPLSILLASSGLILGLGSVVVHKTQRICDSKAKKHQNIKTLAEAKLDSISSLLLKTDIFPITNINLYSKKLNNIES